MASAIPGLESYDGLYTDVQIAQIAQVFGVSLAAQARSVVSHGIPAPVEPTAIAAGRDNLFALLLEHKDNGLLEASMLSLLSEWNALPPAGVVRDEKGNRLYSVVEAKRSIYTRAQSIYPLIVSPEPHGGGDTVRMVGR